MTIEGPRNYSGNELFKPRRGRMFEAEIGDYKKLKKDVNRRIPEFPSVKRNKVFFLLINTFGGNLAGLGRMYTGCILSGFIKLALLLLSVYMVMTDNKNSKIPIIVWLIWVYIDAILVIINSWKVKTESPYCSGDLFNQYGLIYSIPLSFLFGIVVFGVYSFVIYQYYPKLP
jgi:hypothetical protein